MATIEHWLEWDPRKHMGDSYSLALRDTGLTTPMRTILPGGRMSATISIDGMAHLMAPAPALDHQDIAGEICFQLRRSLERVILPRLHCAGGRASA